MSDAGYPAGCVWPTPPWNAPELDAKDVREIERRAQELAGEAFDNGDNTSSRWLRDRPDEEMRDLAELAIGAVSGFAAATKERLEQEVSSLREAYIHECADLYREQAEQEQREHEAAVEENARGDEGKERAWSGR